jgi:hypothetical protein
LTNRCAFRAIVDPLGGPASGDKDHVLRIVRIKQAQPDDRVVFTHQFACAAGDRVEHVLNFGAMRDRALDLSQPLEESLTFLDLDALSFGSLPEGTL